MREHERHHDEHAGVFQPDTLLASQYFDRVRGHGVDSGERRLMVAVLEDALRTYLKHVAAETAERQELFREVEDWIEDRDATWLYAFENVCAVLDVDVDYIRRGLRARKARAQGDQEGAEAPREPTLRRASGA